MKKTFIICFLLSFSVQFVIAQPTQAEIDKKMKQAQEQMKNDAARKKAMKDLQDQQKQVSDAIKNQQGNNNAVTNPIAIGSLYSSDPGSYGNVDNWRFPAKNIALLSSLPKKVFTKAELISFLNNVYSQLSKKLPPGISSSVQSIAAKYNNDGNQMGDLAVTGWYTDYREEALLLIIKAAANSPDNGILLNNCAALLNMSGIEQKAIPILKYVLQSYPENSMLLNNLGQAYAGLGETDTAMVYLGRCMKIEPEHPEACNTAGQIEATKGNKEKAIQYFEKSIKSAYTKTAALKMRKIKKDSKIAPLVRPRVKISEYFNQFKCQLPAQCTSTENAAVAEAEHNAFRNMITKQTDMYINKHAALGEKKYQKIMKANGAGRILKKDEFVQQSFYGLCATMSQETGEEYGKALIDIVFRVDKKYYEEIKRLENEYNGLLQALKKGFAERKDRCCGEGKTTSCCPTTEEECTAYNNLANQYLPKFAMLTEEWQQNNMLVHQQYFDEVTYWHYLSLHPTGDDNFRIQFFMFIKDYLVTMNKVCQTKIIKPCEFTPTSATKESNAINEMECPLEIEIPFVVGKFELNCEKFSFQAGEGVVFGYEKNFKSRQSTVSVGIGLKLELQGKVGPVKAGVSVSIGETLFITFDGDNKFSDGGLRFDAKATAGLETEAGKIVKGKKDIAKEETGVGYTLGINSGWDFNEGPFKGMIGPAPEVPLNKNIKVYKPG